MNSRVKLSVLGIVGWASLGVMSAQEKAQAPAERPAKRTVSDVERGLAELARSTEDERRGLEREFSDKRRELVEGDEWRGLSRLERRAKLGALNDDYKGKEEALKEGYKSKREDLVRERQALEDTAETESSAL